MEPTDKTDKDNDLIDRISAAAKELGLDSAIADIGERLVYDKRPQLADTYLFGQTADNEQSEFQAALQMQQGRLAGRFWVINSIEAEGFPGYVKWHERLGRIIDSESVKPLPIPADVRERFQRWPYSEVKTKQLIDAHCNVNTLSEAQSLVAFAKAENKPFLYAVSTPFHMVRAYMTLASEILQSGQNISVYFYCGAILPWNEVVVHSQGMQVRTRGELVAEDMAKIQTYSNILPAKDILRYMDRRAYPAVSA